MKRDLGPTAVGDLLGRTHDGQIEIGRGTPGCRHCGHRDSKYAGNGAAVLHHPGAECCADAVRDQIGWRKADLENLRAATKRDQAELDEARTVAHESVGRDAATAESRAAKISRANHRRLEARTATAAEIKEEIRRLEQILERHTTGEAQRLPRPYSDA